MGSIKFFSESAGIYAQALFKSCTTNEELASRQEELFQIAHLLKEKELMRFLTACHIHRASKRELLEKLFSQPTAHLLLRLITKGRLKKAPEIALAFQSLADKQLNREHVRLLTSHPLSSTLRDRFKMELIKRFNKEILMEEEVDPDIIGGFILYYNHHKFDASLLGRLNSMKKTI